MNTENVVPLFETRCFIRYIAAELRRGDFIAMVKVDRLSGWWSHPVLDTLTVRLEVTEEGHGQDS